MTIWFMLVGMMGLLLGIGGTALVSQMRKRHQVRHLTSVIGRLLQEKKEEAEDRRSEISKIAESLETERQADVSSALAEAYRRLDETEEASLPPNVFGLPPRRRPVEPKEPPVERPMHKTEVPGHPCFHLSAERPSHFREGECGGTCTHRTQQGRICFWPAATARNCPVFTPKVVMQQVRLTKTGS